VCLYSFNSGWPMTSSSGAPTHRTLRRKELRTARDENRSGVLGLVAEVPPSVRPVRTGWDGEVQSGEMVGTGSR
jgi:hypothetical protein